MIQGSEEWRAARAGSLGASQIHEALARTKTGWGASRGNLAARLVVERLTGEPMDSYVNAAMQHGIDTEPLARIAYEFYSGEAVEQVGIIKHPDIAWTHASPDGLVGDRGLIEIKAPQPAQHLATLDGQSIAEKYIYQMQWQMRCCGRDWCDFVSFSPFFPEAMRLFVQRVKRDDDLIRDLEAEVVAFLNELRETVDRLRAKYEPENDELPEAVRLLMAG